MKKTLEAWKAYEIKRSRKKLSRLEEANREKELKRSSEYKKLDEVLDSLMPKIEIIEIDTNKISTDKPKREIWNCN